MKKARLMSHQHANPSQLIQHEQADAIRLNKYISQSGFCSRREADRHIESGAVKIDGQLAEVGTKVFAHQHVTVNGQAIVPKQAHVYLALNKPVGVTSTTDTKVEGNLTEFMDYPEMIFPIGRLDKESTGLLLMTNDGDIVNKILREENGHDKSYKVAVDQPISEEFLKQMAQGVTIFNPVTGKHQKTKKCQVKQVSTYQFEITLQQGLNRQIRRMAQALGYHVTALERTRVMMIELGNLKPGYYRYLSEKELIALNEALKNSTK